ELLLDALALGNVFDNTKPKWRYTLHSWDKSNVLTHPKQSAVLATITLLDLEMLSLALRKLASQQYVSFTVPLVRNFIEAQSVEFRFCVSQHVSESAVRGEIVNVKVGHNYSDCCAFEGGSPSFVGLLSQSPLTDTMAVRVGVRQWSFGTSQKL